MNAFYTVSEVAKLFRVNVTKVGRWIDSGELKAVNVGNGKKQPRYRISESALQKFAESRETAPKTKTKPRRRKRYSGRTFIS